MRNVILAILVSAALGVAAFLVVQRTVHAPDVPRRTSRPRLGTPHPIWHCPERPVRANWHCKPRGTLIIVR